MWPQTHTHTHTHTHTFYTLYFIFFLYIYIIYVSIVEKLMYNLKFHAIMQSSGTINSNV